MATIGAIKAKGRHLRPLSAPFSSTLPTQWPKFLDFLSNIFHIIPLTLCFAQFFSYIPPQLRQVNLPTTMLIILSQMVNRFTEEYLDMVVQVNLTVMLVLATLWVLFSTAWSFIHTIPSPYTGCFFFTGPPPRKFKYGKPRLGEVMCI